MWISAVCYKYVLLPLVNKETALAYDSTEYSKAEREEESRQSRADAM